MEVWFNGKLTKVEPGQKFSVLRWGMTRAIFGEEAELRKVTRNHLVFRASSGVVVKTSTNNLNKVVGKVARKGYVVTTRPLCDIPGIIYEEVASHEKKTCHLVKR